MSLLSDPAELDALADRVSAQAVAARARALGLAASVAAVTWHGVAARAFALEAHTVIAGLRSAAAHLDDTADALHRHARRVRTMQGLLDSAICAGLPVLEGALRGGRALLDGVRDLDG